MNKLDEGLDELFVKYSYDPGCAEHKQAILDLMCKHRGCEPEPPKTKWPRYSYDEALWEIEGPCKWCGKEQP